MSVGAAALARPPRILVVDVGGTRVKLLVSGADEPRGFDAGPGLTPERMVAGTLETARGWSFEGVTLGCPAPVRHGRPMVEPPHLGAGWVGFDFEHAFGCPVRVINDAAMQALGSYQGGRMLFLGLGTGLGSALVVDGVLVPLELGHLPYRKGKCIEDYVGVDALDRFGRAKWERHVRAVIALLQNATLPDYVVLGGGNVNRLDELPEGVRRGDNERAFLGGFRLWEGSAAGGQGQSGTRP